MNHANRILLVIFSAGFLGLNTLSAANNSSLKSSYLGEGLFRYEMIVHRDPFFSDEKNSFTIEFSNLIEVVEYSPNWQFLEQTNSISLNYPPENLSLDRPYNAYCIVRSSHTNYCTIPRQEAAAIIHGSLLPTVDMLGSPLVSGNLVFYSKMEVVIPCSEAHADGSPAICERHFEIIPDVLINEIIISNGIPYGLSFSWNSDSTVLAQASTNLQDWVDIQYILGTAPSTEWISPEPLENFGKFYRLLLVAQGHHSELLGEVSPMMAIMSQIESPSTPAYTIQSVEKGVIKLNIETTPSAHYLVSINQHKTSNSLFTTEFVADSNHQTINLNVADFPPSASIEVIELKD